MRIIDGPVYNREKGRMMLLSQIFLKQVFKMLGKNNLKIEFSRPSIRNVQYMCPRCTEWTLKDHIV